MPNCSAINCSNGAHNGYKVHKFPREPARRALWIQNCRRDKWTPSETAVLCDVHFEESQFESKRQDGRRLLKWDAVPTLFDVPNKPKQVTVVRINPLDRKRSVTDIVPSVSSDMVVAPKKTRYTDGFDHSYSRNESGNVREEPNASYVCGLTSASCFDHTYVKCVEIAANGSSAECNSSNGQSSINQDLPATSSEVINDNVLDVHSVLVSHCTSVSCRNTIMKLRLQVRQLQRKVNDLQRKFFQQASNVNTFLASDQIKYLQANAASRNKGVVWSLETVRQAFQIRYICGAQGYEFIRSLHYPLPSYRTLCDRIQQTAFRPGIQSDVIQWMKYKLESSAEQERDCVLMLDEMAIKQFLEYDKGLRSMVGFVSSDVLGSNKSDSLASHALVFMVRGLTTNWKQIVGYYLTGASVEGDILWTLVREIIDKLHSVDVHVRVVVCDMGSCNRAMWRSAGVVTCKEQIVNAVEHPTLPDQRLYFLPDIPHVLKNVRNCLLSHDIILPPEVVQQYNLPGPLVSVSHVRALVDLQESSELKIVPSLRRKHVEPKQFEKMKVSTAAQMFSHSTSSGLKFCVASSLLPTEALTTAWFLELINQWFDVCNARTKLQALHPKSLTKLSSLHTVMSLAPKLTYCSRTSANPIATWKPIQTGLLMASKSLIDVHNDFVGSGKYKYLMTSRLSQDALENLFSQIRGRGDSHPTPVKFRHSLRLICISQFTKTPKNSSYDSADVSRYAVPLLRNKSKKVSSETEINAASNEVVIDTVLQMGISDTNALAYLAGWIAFKLKCKTDCGDCLSWLVKNDDDERSVDESPELQLTVLKSYGGSERGLTLPSTNLFKFVLCAEAIFVACKQSFVKELDIQTYLLTQSADLLTSDIPKCHDIGCVVLNRFFKLRLHIYGKEVSNRHSDGIQHGSKSAKARTVIK